MLTSLSDGVRRSTFRCLWARLQQQTARIRVHYNLKAHMGQQMSNLSLSKRNRYETETKRHVQANKITFSLLLEYTFPLRHLPLAYNKYSISIQWIFGKTMTTTKYW